MDCEGCEYAVYAELEQEEDWTFFERVDQLVLEVHLPRKYALNDAECVYSLPLGCQQSNQRLERDGVSVSESRVSNDTNVRE